MISIFRRHYSIYLGINIESLKIKEQLLRMKNCILLVRRQFYHDIIKHKNTYYLNNETYCVYKICTIINWELSYFLWMNLFKSNHFVTLWHFYIYLYFVQERFTTYLSGGLIELLWWDGEKLTGRKISEMWINLKTLWDIRDFLNNWGQE